MGEGGFKAGLIHLAPVLASLLVGVLCAYLLFASPIELYSVTPFSEDPAGSVGNALYFVVLVGVGATILFFLLKRKRDRLIAIVVGFSLATAAFLLSFVYFSAALGLLGFSFIEILVPISALLTVLVCYTIFKTRSKVGDFIVLLLGGALGAFLGACVPTLSTVLILCFLAVYDAFAVYRGPVGKIAREGLEKFRGLSFSFRDIHMGLGDLTFYSMLAGHMLIYFGLLPCLASAVGILLGCFLAFKMLEKGGVFPGLPFPIAFGLVLGFLAVLFSQWMGLELIGLALGACCLRPLQLFCSF
ncbi:MAG: presenilin family intramembrane aspartyl protease [Candidatus Bathyarchaeia archaeon]